MSAISVRSKNKINMVLETFSEDMIELLSVFRELRIDLLRSYFRYYHVIKTLEIIDRMGPMGRSGLSKILNIGEGSSRNLIKKMKSIGLLEIDPVAGAIITDRGRRILNIWRNNVSSACVESKDLVNWRYLSINRISEDFRRSLLRNKSIIDLRDELIKRGCLGGLFAENLSGRVMLLNVRGEPDYDITDTETGKRIRDFCEGFCIVSGSDNNCLKAEECVWDLLIEILLREYV